MAPRARSAAASAVAFGVILALGACGTKVEETVVPLAVDEASDAVFGEPEASYTVRGIIEQLPQAPVRDLKIQHEPIPDFRGSNGQVFVNADGVPGMKAMTMDFPLVVDGVDLSGFTTGDIVEFTFELRWRPQGGAVYRITRMTKLPADTVLNFDNPPAVAP